MEHPPRVEGRVSSAHRGGRLRDGEPQRLQVLRRRLPVRAVPRKRRRGTVRHRGAVAQRAVVHPVRALREDQRPLVRRDVGQRDPQRAKVVRLQRRGGQVLVPGRGAVAGLLEEGAVLVQPDALGADQAGGDLADAAGEHQVAHDLVLLPEVVGAEERLVGGPEARGGGAAAGGGEDDPRGEGEDLLGGEQGGEEAVALVSVLRDLLGRDGVRIGGEQSREIGSK